MSLVLGALLVLAAHAGPADAGGKVVDGCPIRPGASCARADLREVDLRGFDLRKVNLTGADLEGANLRGANLGSAQLRRANLTGADLRSADLRGADLREADLEEARLGGIELCRTVMPDGELDDSDCSD